jgi:hypothetical protein
MLLNPPDDTPFTRQPRSEAAALLRLLLLDHGASCRQVPFSAGLAESRSDAARRAATRAGGGVR